MLFMATFSVNNIVWTLIWVFGIGIVFFYLPSIKMHLIDQIILLEWNGIKDMIGPNRLNWIKLVSNFSISEFSFESMAKKRINISYFMIFFILFQ